MQTNQHTALVQSPVRRVVRVMGASGDLVSKISHLPGRLLSVSMQRVAEKDGVAVLKDEMYGIQKADGRLPRVFQENV